MEEKKKEEGAIKRRNEAKSQTLKNPAFVAPEDTGRKSHLRSIRGQEQLRLLLFLKISFPTRGVILKQRIQVYKLNPYKLIQMQTDSQGPLLKKILWVNNYFFLKGIISLVPKVGSTGESHPAVPTSDHPPSHCFSRSGVGSRVCAFTSSIFETHFPESIL